MNLYIFVLLAIIVAVLVIFNTRLRGFLGQHSGAFGVVFGLVAAISLLYQHYIGEQNRQLDRTRAYIERIESGTVHESRQWFDLHWIKNRELIDQIEEALDGKAPDLKAGEKLKSEYLEDFDENDAADIENVRHLMRLMYFYADLAKCVELGLCDSESACDIFDADISTFYVLHSEFISRWEQVSFKKNVTVIKNFLNKTCGVG